MKKLSHYVFSGITTFRYNFIKDFELDIGVELGKTEARVLHAIFECPEQTMSVYASVIGVENGSFTTIADNLIKKGLIERYYDSQDRRKRLLRFTEVGEEKAKYVAKQAEKYVKQKFELLDADAKKEILDALIVLDKYKNKI